MSGPAITRTGKWIDLWEGYWFGPVAATRPYLLIKAVLLLLAFDMWLLRIEKGAEYGIFEFNVAHFPWLDVIQPIPTPGLYVGLVLSVGILALVCTFAGASRWALVLLALSYTYTWMMSLLYSWQHYYFLSLVLFAFLFFPILHATEIYRHGPSTEGELPLVAKIANTTRQTVSSWGYKLLGVNVAIVYFYTAVTKLSESEFLQGEILSELTYQKRSLRPIATWIANLNIDPHLFFQLAAWGVIALEIFLAIAYLSTVRLDESRSRWLQVVAWFGFIGVVSFHGIGNEILAQLDIGWFSYYMIAIACVYFLPARILWVVGSLMTWPARTLLKLQAKLLGNLTERKVLDIGVAFGGLVVAVGSFLVGFYLDLPGGKSVGLLGAIGLAGATITSLFLRRQLEFIRLILASALAVGIMWFAISLSMVRFEYYTLAGKLNRDQGNLEAAIKDIEKAIYYGSARTKKAP